MKNELKNIFSSQEPTRRVVSVVSRISSTRYRVTDSTGRDLTALSTTLYSPGTAVLLEAGRIIGPAIPANTRTYEV